MKTQILTQDSPQIDQGPSIVGSEMDHRDFVTLRVKK